MKQFACQRVCGQVTEGEVLRSADSILFYCADPETGVVTEDGHCLQGISVKDKILVCPGGKGSSSVQAEGMYRLAKHGSAPRALIVEELDTVLVSSAVVMEMPMVYGVDPAFYQAVKNGSRVRIDAKGGLIWLLD